MKKIFIISLIVSFMLNFAEQLNGQNISTQLKESIELQVDSVFKTMVKAAEVLDYDKLNQGVDDNRHAGFISNGTYFEQFDALIDKVKALSQGITKQALTIQSKKITALSEQFVILVASVDAKINTASGNQFTTKFNWSFVYEKFGNSWKVIHSNQFSQR